MTSPIAFGPARHDEDLLAGPSASFAEYLQPGVPAEERALTGLHACFKSAFPMTSSDRRIELTYESYTVEKPRYEPASCLDRGMTYAGPIKVLVRLVVYETSGKEPVVSDIKEQEVYFGETPLMVNGAFLVWGERKMLVPEDKEIWLPRDGMPAVPRQRRMLAGHWLELAAWEGMAAMREAILRRMTLAANEMDYLMPHDLINAKPVAMSMQRLFKSRTRAPTVEKGNPLTRLDRISPVAESLVPLADSDDERAAGAAALRGARTPAEPTVPRLAAGLEEAAARAASLVHRAPFAAELEIVDGVTAIAWPTSGDVQAERALVRIHPYLGGSEEGDATRFTCESGATLAAGDVFAEASGALGGTLALGREALVRWDPKAKGAVVSTSFAAAMMARRLERYEAVCKDTWWGKEELSSEMLDGGDWLDDEGIVLDGAAVNDGMPIVGISSWANNGLDGRTSRGRRRPRFRSDVEPPRRDASVRVREGGAGTVVRVETFHRKGSESNGREIAIEAAAKERFERVGQAAARRTGSMGEELGHLAQDLVWQAQRGDELPPGVIRMIRVTVREPLPLVVGSVLSDRRGYRARVTRIVPDAEMPAFGDQRVDVVLPARDVPESTVREARLTLAGRLLNEWYTGAPSDEDIERCAARAGLPAHTGGAFTGALYLLRLRERAMSAKAAISPTPMAPP
jgi:DNA-directed RNA polymerase beta subunit